MNFDQNIILIVLAAVIGISRLIARMAEKSREQTRRKTQAQRSKRARPPIVMTRPKTDEERVREFLEALGQAPGTTPPPKVTPRTDIPPRPVGPIQPPPLGRPFSPVPVRPVVEKVRKVFAPRTSPVLSSQAQPEAAETNEPGAWIEEEQKVESAAAKFEAATREKESGPMPALMWRDALRSPESVRSAIVLREILGPPRALRELELA